MQYSGGTATQGPAQPGMYPCQPQGPSPQWGTYTQQPPAAAGPQLQPQGPGPGPNPYYGQQIPPQG